ncbi:MAG: glycosyltransferase [Flavobacteriales bacterium]|nr:glycosyltransferase [Flavobacteriales bacterium]
MNALVWRTWKVKIARELRVRGSAVIDAVLYAVHVPPSIPATAKVDDALFYVAELLMARAGRMAKWVTRQSGRKVVLFCHREGYIPEFAGEGFAAVLLYRNAWHLRRLIRAMPHPWIVHGFAPKSHYPDVARRALPNVPYIHDLQDTLVVYYGTTPTKRWLRAELPHERACMAEADGVIAHSLEPAEGFRRYGIPHRTRPRTLFFPLYCDDDRFVTMPKISATETHLVYAGGVAGSHRDPRYFGNIQFFGLIETLTKQRSASAHLSQSNNTRRRPHGVRSLGQNQPTLPLPRTGGAGEVGRGVGAVSFWYPFGLCQRWGPPTIHGEVSALHDPEVVQIFGSWNSAISSVNLDFQA